jgi:hypothetical protein
MDERRDDRSLGQLFGDLTRQLTTLVRQEVDLARAEVTTKLSTTARDGALIGLGGAMLYAAVLGLMATLVLLLVEADWDPWLAALVVTLIAAAIGGALVVVGRNRLAEADLGPTRTIETLRADADRAKELAK